MTKRIQRRVTPYTNNHAYSTATATDRFLLNIVASINEFFVDPPLVNECFDSVWNAATRYEFRLTSNQDRKISQRQRKDFDELLETLRELRIRLDPSHLPLPLIATAKAAFRPERSRSSTFEEEVENALQVIDYLRYLFREGGIPEPKKTNPGRPERDALIAELGNIFDSLSVRDTSYEMSTQADLRAERREFIRTVCNLIDPSIKLPRQI